MSFELNGYYKQVGEADISKELDCVNTLQKTQWRVNKYVLEVMEQCWNSGSKWKVYQLKMIYLYRHTLSLSNHLKCQKNSR